MNSQLSNQSNDIKVNSETEGSKANEIFQKVIAEYEEKIKKLLDTKEKAHKVEIKDIMHLSKAEAINFMKKSTENVVESLTNEHRVLVKKALKWVRIADENIEKNALLEMRVREAEKYSAKTNPVLQANFALDDDHPLQLYDCLIPVIKKHKHANPYDCFEIDVIANWRKVALENEALKA